MSKHYIYQYVCFDIRDKQAVEQANMYLEKYALEGYDLDWSVTENRTDEKSDIRLNRLRKEIK